MKTETTILKIKQELISMFASLDAWFDILLDDGFDPRNDSDELDWIEHVLFSNQSLLHGLLPTTSSRPFSGNDHDLYQTSFEALRETLREQLFYTLVVIDSLEESALEDRGDRIKQMDVHDKLFVMGQHLRYHLELLEVNDNG